MNEKISVSIMQDLRREKENKSYPLKLRVYCGFTKKRKLYKLNLDYTKKEFHSIYKSERVNQKYKEEKKVLSVIENRANKIIKELTVFTFKDFERLMFGNVDSSTKTINFFYNKAIESYKSNNRISTANNYIYSLKSLLDFHGKSVLLFETITSDWLDKYESRMLKNEKSSTTIGYYLRPLRAIFNTAIESKAISIDIYPFGKRKYSIPNPKGVKKALTKEQLKVLYESEPKTKEQAKAKAFWFFSYLNNGMNMKDILYLKYKNIQNDMIVFHRAKTIRTNKDQKPISAPLHDFSINVIQEYGNENKSPESLIFPIINVLDEPTTQLRQKDNFIRFINQHMLKFAKECGIEENISTYWARHSFATVVVRSGGGLEIVSEALGHSNLNTTKNYFAGFEDEKKKEIAKRLLDF